MIKNLILLAILVGVGYWAFQTYGTKLFSSDGAQFGVKVGESRDDAEAALGKPYRTLPNFGRDLCQYHTKNGDITVFYEGGKVDEVKLNE
jgi:hypothetical protein